MSEAYNYEDEEGNVLYRVIRYGSKNFRQEHPEDGEWVSGRGESNSKPYHLPEVLDAIEAGKPVWIFEGEKDVEAARLQGLTATCNSGGAGKWNDNISYWLRAAEPVYICWDNDEQGRKHALAIEQSLRRAGVTDLKFRRAAVGKDFTDHVTAGKTVAQLVKMRPKVQPKIEEVDENEIDPNEFLPAPFQLALSKLRKVTAEYGPDKENQFNAMCPAHEDTSPSLSIRPGEDVAVLVHCHAGCTPKQIAVALGIHPQEFTKIVGNGDEKQAQLNEQAYMRKKANADADQRIMQERALTTLSLDDVSIAEELAKPLVPTKWFIDSWFKSSTAVLLNADPKAGKTRLALNLMKALSENEPFLGRFQTNLPDGKKIWYGNWDQPEDLMLEYLHDYNWLAPERCIMKHIGAHEFPFWIPSMFDSFVSYAKRNQIHCMVIDTLHIAAQGFVTDENNNNEMAEFVSLLRKLTRAAEIPNLLVIHHTGHSSTNRGRGASTLAADFDGMWFLHVDDSEKFDAPRKLSAKGRKLGVQPVDLVYNVATESYSYRGAMPAKAGSNAVDPDLMREYLAFVDRIAAFQKKNERWPKATEARRMTRKKANERTGFLRAVEGLSMVVRRTVGDHDEIQVA